MVSTMDELVSDFESFKISALRKAKLIGDQVKEVTIGPHSLTSPIKKETKNKPVNKPSDSSQQLRRPHTTPPIKRIVAELEKDRQKKVQEAVNSRISKFTEFSKEQECIRKQQWLEQQQGMVEKMQQQEMLILKTLEQYDKNSSDQHEMLVQYYQNVAEKQKKNAEKLQENERKRQLINSIIDSIRKDQADFRTTYQEIASLLKNSSHDILKTISPTVLKQLKYFPESMEEIITRCKAGKITEDESRRSAELLQSLQNLKVNIQETIASFMKTQEQQAVKENPVIKQENTAKPNFEDPLPSTPQVTTMQKIQNDVPDASHSTVKVTPSVIEKYVSRTNFKIYSELQDFLENYKACYKELRDDESLKQFKFDLKKAVNIPVNAISAVSTQHLMDKYKRLHNLLSGKPVIVGETQVSASKHPQGVMFCTDLLAKKFVLQGDLMVSSNPEAAFCYAAMIVALWNDFPDFGKLVLAHFYEDCPYLLPWYVPRSAEQTNEEYYKSQGYKYTDGVVEKQDKFLKRMTGMMRLYSAIFITKPKKGHSTNPHGLAQGWRWLASILSLEPRLDITANMLHVFFEIAGYSMQVAYGKMFHKIMRFVRDKYVPMLVKIDSGGPVTRLSVLLEEYRAREGFEQPNGILPNNFW